MSKYLVLIIFAFSIFLSKVYLDSQEQKESSGGSRLNVDDQGLISKNVNMNGRYDYIDRTDYQGDDEEYEKEKNKNIQKEEEKEVTKKSKKMNKENKVKDENKDKQKNRSWWIFGD